MDANWSIDVTSLNNEAGITPDALERIASLPDATVTMNLQPATAEDLRRTFAGDPEAGGSL